nr:LysR family transcriptional regulator [Xanthobacter tagetidis]
MKIKYHSQNWNLAVDLSSLEVFRAVAETGSVTRAAAALDRAPSNVTTRVRALEDDLGVALFLRDGKRMALTAEGETFLGYALRLLALEAEARGAVRPGIPSGRLRLGAMESTAASRLPEPLARFHASWPEVALDLATGTSRDLAERVRAHDLDCALIAAAPGVGDGLDPGLEAVPLFAEDLLLVAPAGHGPIAGPDDVGPDTLAALPAGCTYRAVAEAWLQGRRAGRPLRRIELASYDAMLACVAAGVAVAVVPRSVLDLRPGLAHLVTVPIARLPTLLIRRRGYRSAAFEALKAVLAASHQAA